jgi:hypothetical protein
MKKLISLTIILMFFASAYAAVTISGNRSGTSVTVNYCASGNSVRAFALDFTVTTGTITAVNCTSSSPLGYYIYPGQIVIQSGSIADFNSCVCSPAKFPGVTQPGLGTSAVTVEMASLYTGTSKPASSGQLLTLTLSDSAACISVSRNTARGGIVMEDPDEAANDNLPIICPPPDCLYVGRVFHSTAGFNGLTVTTAHIAKWNYLGKPNCWCCLGQKRGNCIYTGASANRPDTIDLGAIKGSSWMCSYTQPCYNPCCDFNLSGRIDTVDLGMVKNTNNWMKSVGAGPPCP